MVLFLISCENHNASIGKDPWLMDAAQTNRFMFLVTWWWERVVNGVREQQSVNVQFEAGIKGIC